MQDNRWLLGGCVRSNIRGILLCVVMCVGVDTSLATDATKVKFICDGMATPTEPDNSEVVLVSPERGPVGSTDTNVVWRFDYGKNKSLAVCWESPDGKFKTEKSWVYDQIVNRTWGLASDLHFRSTSSDEGPWQACKHDKHEEEIIRLVRIKITDAAFVRSNTDGFGRQLKESEGLLLNFGNKFGSRDKPSSVECDLSDATGAYGASDREKCIRMIAAHEFGHVLGFFHEDRRLDDDVKCYGSEGTTASETTTRYVDHESVMNYCARPFLHNGKLSQGDKLSAECLYCPKDVQCKNAISVSAPSP